MPITSDSDVYKQTFYGILNKQGEFWTPLAFDSEKAARDHLQRFWATKPETLAQVLQSHKIVPVRIQLTALEALPA